LPIGGRGRPRKYCGETCRKRAQRAAELPKELTSRARWVRRRGKRPVTETGFAASVTDSTTWTSYGRAKASKRGDGLGFVLGDGVACLDLDDVVTDGRLDPAAAKLLASLPATFTEVSMSGRGLHIFGLLPEAPGRVRTVGGIKIELYSRERFIAVTGKRWPGAPATLANLSAALG
jgi:primase-polymerase (primpol)-like protein